MFMVALTESDASFKLFVYVYSKNKISSNNIEKKNKNKKYLNVNQTIKQNQNRFAKICLKVKKKSSYFLYVVCSQRIRP